MKTLCWNCQGIGNPQTVWALRHGSRKFCPDIIFLSETMVSSKYVEGLCTSFGCYMTVGVDNTGRSGGLCIYWKNEVDFSLVSFSAYHICGDIKETKGNIWRFTGIYGWADAANKFRTWDLIHNICSSSPHPIMFGGDFNEILSNEEKTGGLTRDQRMMDNFREVLEICSFRDLGFEGRWVTWERGLTPETLIQERLDRFVATTNWCSAFQTIKFFISRNTNQTMLLFF